MRHRSTTRFKPLLAGPGTIENKGMTDGASSPQFLRRLVGVWAHGNQSPAQRSSRPPRCIRGITRSRPASPGSPSWGTSGTAGAPPAHRRPRLVGFAHRHDLALSLEGCGAASSRTSRSPQVLPFRAPIPRCDQPGGSSSSARRGRLRLAYRDVPHGRGRPQADRRDHEDGERLLGRLGDGDGAAYERNKAPE